MDKLPFDTKGLTNGTIDNFTDLYATIKNGFNLHATGHINFCLEEFEAFRNCIEVNLRASYVLKNERSDSYLLFLETRHNPVSEKDETAKDFYLYHTWALAYLKKDFGRVVIRPETLRDKIIELIHPIELDFSEERRSVICFTLL
jgi:hypothetical protein